MDKAFFVDSANSKKMNTLNPKSIYKEFMTGIVLHPGKGGSKEEVQQIDEFFLRKLPAPTIEPPLEPKSKTFNWLRLELMSTKVAVEEEGCTETLRCLWPFFKFARVIGMCPITRKGNDLVVQKPWHPSWWMTWIALGIQVIMVANASKSLPQSTNGKEVVQKINRVIYYGHTLANALYMLARIRMLPQFLLSCKRIEKICKKHQMGLKPDGLVRQCFFLLTFFTVAQALGNAIYFYSVVEKEKARSIPGFFQAFNSEFLGSWGSYYSGIFFCFAELYSDMGWAYADILLSLISVVFGWFFKRINTILGKKSTVFTLTKIEELRMDHREICHLVELCNNVFSPLFLLNYVANVAYLFTRLYTGFADDLSHPVPSVRIESIYAFCYQILVKILAPTYFAARLHEMAHEGLKLIHNWSSALEDPESKFRLLVIVRFVSQLVTTPVGISGCGYFIISKSFMVTLISALVTYEVILLQFQGASLKTE